MHVAGMVAMKWSVASAWFPHGFLQVQLLGAPLTSTKESQRKAGCLLLAQVNIDIFQRGENSSMAAMVAFLLPSLALARARRRHSVSHCASEVRHLQIILLCCDSMPVTPVWPTGDHVKKAYWPFVGHEPM